MPLSEKSLIGRYEIRSQLGAGGMGEVYLAHDTQLHRAVALKILPAHLSSDRQRMRRFTQEARTASALSHPNIITIYEIGHLDSAHFIATEYVDGVTLRHLMAGAPMTLQDILDIVIQVASALTSAHAAGIIHRDIKPENIMLRRDGYVKVLDFGLAKLTEKSHVGVSNPEASTVSVMNTDPGMVMGTVPYMSPEQVRGQMVDERTDIWSLGCVLYEMITGRLPFKGATSSDIIALILEREPLPLSHHAPETPKELERIVMKALSKDAEERYQSVKDLLIDLRRLKQQLEREALERSVKQTVIVEEQRSTEEKQTARDTNKDSLTEKQQDSTQASSAEYIIGEIKNNKRMAILALLLLITVGVWLTYYFSSRKSAIAVLPFNYRTDLNEAADPLMEELSDGITKGLIDNLAQQLSPKLNVKQRSTVFRYKGPEVDPQKAGRELGARWVLTGRVYKSGNMLIVQVELNDVDNESQIWGETYKREQVGAVEPVALQEEFSRQIMDKVRTRLSEDAR